MRVRILLYIGIYSYNSNEFIHIQNIYNQDHTFYCYKTSEIHRNTPKYIDTSESERTNYGVRAGQGQGRAGAGAVT